MNKKLYKKEGIVTIPSFFVYNRSNRLYRVKITEEKMRVETKNVQPGFVLEEDVYALASDPLMLKGTVLTKELIDILEVFLIPTVEVLDRPKVEEQNVIEQADPTVKKAVQTSSVFTQMTKEYKAMLKKYQSGGKVDILKVRSFFVPIVTNVLEDKNVFFKFYEEFDQQEYFSQRLLAVGMLSALLGKELGYSTGDCIQLGIAGLLCDIGMTKIPEKVYKKAAKLTSSERNEIKKHPVYSYKMIKDLPSLTEEAVLGVLQHHEREDGSGYPLGLKGEKQTRFSKVIAVSDVFVALISDRSYQEKVTLFEALEIMNVQEREKYNREVMKQLTNLIILYIRTK